MPSDIEYALLSTRVYAASADNRTGVPAGWTELTWQADYRFSGFSAGAYRRGGEVVIAYTGTNDKSLDWLFGNLATLGLAPAPQVFAAMRFYLDIKAANPDATSFTFAGHSLGGGLASLMAVFFDKQATVFDEAPFQLSAMNPVLLTSLQASLLLNSYTDLDFALYNASFGALLPFRQSNVSHTYLEGEILSPFRVVFPTIVGVGQETPISMGSSTLGAGDRHTMTLLTAMLGNAAFKSVVQQLPNLATYLLDPTWVGVTDRRTPDRIDLLSNLLQWQYGAEGKPADGRLDRFAADMQQLLGNAGLAQTNVPVRDALTAASMEYFHTKADKAADKLFTLDGNGLHFKYSDIGASSYKSLPLLARAIETLLGPAQSFQTGIYGRLIRQDAWHIQSGSAGMTWAATGADNDAAIGGDQADVLDAGAGNDVLLGFGGSDTLTGGAGDDFLIGGAGSDTLNGGDGYDTYIIEGSDTIEDSDGKGVIKDQVGNILSGFIEKRQDGSHVFLTDSTVSVTKGVDLKLTFGSGNSVTIKNYTDGDLGLNVTEEIIEPENGNLIFGDQAPLVTNTGHYDSLGHLILHQESDVWGNIIPIGPEPDRNDSIYDTSGNDLINAGGGTDFVFKNRGGDDIIDLGAGDDYLDASSYTSGRIFVRGGDGRDLMGGGNKNDIIEGGADADGFHSADGDDQLYGDIKGNAQDFITQGATQQGNGVQGDWFDAGDGNDQIFGGAGNDAAAGGHGNDLIVTGGGTDWIFGDWNNTPDGLWLWRDWTVTETVTLDINGNKIYTYDVTGHYSQSNTGFGDDVIYAGAGDDVAFGERGNDMLYLEDGNDKAWGGEGDDNLLGGAGNDELAGDAGDDALTGGLGADFLYGNEGSDSLTGDEGDDQLVGGAGNDALIGGSGQDSLFGEDGDDTLLGDANDDILIGGAGNDTLLGGAGVDELQGGDDNDQLEGGEGDDVLAGDAGDDALYGQAGNDELQGGVGNDALSGEAGNDLLVGGDGDDILTGSLGDDELQGGLGADFLVGGEGADRLFGEAGNDTLYGGAENDMLYGGEGDDVLEGGTGDNQLQGGAGNDTLLGSTGVDVLFGESGDDVLYGGANDDALQGGAGNDILAGEIGNDRLFGEDGDDILTGDDGNDVLVAGSGADLVVGGVGDDLLLGEGDNDALYGGEGNDGIEGGDGDDTLDGGEGDDQLFGQAGDDILHGGQGNDLLVGGGGNDTLNGDAGNDQLQGRDGDDELNGGADNDSLYGQTGDDTLTGGEGDDVLYGDAGIDTLIGGTGNDFLTGGMGDDVLAGGAGDDVYIFNRGDGVDTITDTDANTLNFGGGISVNDLSLGYGSLLIKVGNNGDAIHIGNFNPDDVLAGVGIDRFTFADGTVLNYEQLLALGFDLNGGAGDDVIRGTNVHDRIMGFGGNDTLIGQAGDDTLDGGTGDDVLYGEAGNDQLMGAEGHDTLNGGSGDDVLDGGAGDNALYGGEGNDTYFVNGNSEIVIENLDEGTDTVESTLSYTLGDNIENLILRGLVSLQGVGNESSNAITANDAGNALYGLGGDDGLYGGAGDDLLDGGAGADIMIGGGGNDVYVVDGQHDYAYENDGALGYAFQVLEAFYYSVQIIGQSGDGYTDTVQSSGSYKLLDNLENLLLTGTDATNGTGNRLRNTITGNAASNVLKGNALSPFYWYYGDNEGMLYDRVDSAFRDYVIPHSSAYITLNFLSDQGDILDGQGGDDMLIGTLDNDTLIGGEGNDILEGGVGRDTLIGGAGDDTYIVDATDVHVYTWGAHFYMLDAAGDVLIEEANQGIDTVVSTLNYTLLQNFENLTLTGSANLGIGNEADNRLTVLNYGATLYGLAGNDTLLGGSAWDMLDGGTGADMMEGGYGDDTYIVDDAGDQVIETDPYYTDIVLSSIDYTLGANVENLALIGSMALLGTGNELNNQIIGNGADNLLSGLDGNDVINGEAGADILLGGDGADQLNGGSDADVMNGGAGDDTYYVDSTGDVTDETTGNGHDLVYADITHTLAGGIEDLTLGGAEPLDGAGNALDNLIRGNGYANTLRGLGGNDTLEGGQGDANTLFGGTGDDRYIVYNAADLAIENIGEGVDSVESHATYTLSGNVENLRLLGNFADSPYISWLDGTGNDLDNQIIGNDAQNMLQGMGGQDVMDGRAGNDTMDGGSGNDNLYGGDDAVYRESCAPPPDMEYWDGEGSLLPQGYRETLSSNADMISGGDGNDTIDGGSGDDALFGDAGDDTLYGGNDGLVASSDCAGGGSEEDDGYTPPRAGEVVTHEFLSNNDYLEGGAGNDLLDGGSGNDTLLGGEGDDVLLGGSDGYLNTSNNDYLDGGTGIDTMAGGTGDDVYIVDGTYQLLPPVPADDCDIGAGDEEPGPTMITSADFVIENAGEGYDTIYSSVSMVLPDNVEALQFVGTANIDVVGNADYNFILGNVGNNRIDGGQGADYMAGGMGDDIYYVDSVDDTVMEYSGEGTDTVRAYVDGYRLGADIENLDLARTVGTGYGNELNNKIRGNAVDNMLFGEHGDDVIAGAGGNDQLAGGSGNDTYVFGRGDGRDVVLDTDGDMDRVMLGSDLDAADITLRRDGDDVVIGIKGTHDEMVLTDWFNAANSVESIEFCHGGVIDKQAIERSVNKHTLNTIDDAASVREDVILAVSGNVLANDADAEVGMVLAVTNPGTYAGAFGTLVLDVDGSYAYTLDNASSTVQPLIEGQAVTESFTYLVQDNDPFRPLSSSAVLVVTIIGTNDAPVIQADSADTAEDGVLTAQGNVLANDSDVDQGAVLIVADAGTYTSAYGSLVVTRDGSYTYALDNTSSLVQGLRSGETVTDSFGYAASDGITSTTGSVQVHIVGRNDAPEAMNDVAAVQEDVMPQVNGNVLANDRDVDHDTLLSALNPGTYMGTYGTLALAVSGAYVYTLNNASGIVQSLAVGQRISDSFSYRVQDDDASQPLHDGATLTITIAGTNDAPVLVNPLPDQTAKKNQMFTYQVSADAFVDVDTGDSLTLGATLADGTALPAWLTFNPVTRTFSGVASNSTSGTLTIRANALDRVGASASDIFTLAVTGGATVLKGNEGVGNGEDPPPPGHDVNYNDGTGTSPGQPGNKGGAGNNTYIVKSASDVVTELANEGIDTVQSSVTYTLGTNIENLTLTGATAINGTGNTLNNILSGNSAANTLTGGTGNDTYLFGRGAGQDIANNLDTASTDDKVVFGATIATDQLWFTKDANHLRVSIIGTADQITVQNWYLGSNYTVNKFQTANGSVLLESQVQQLVNAMASMTPPPAGQLTLTAEQQTALNPVLAASWQSAA